MKDEIKVKALELFFKLGFKTVTMDQISIELSISKKTIYKYYETKEHLVKETAELFNQQIYNSVNKIVLKNYNAIEENFEMLQEVYAFKESSSLLELKKYYPILYRDLVLKE